jgi:hypothetical protein
MEIKVKSLNVLSRIEGKKEKEYGKHDKQPEKRKTSSVSEYRKGDFPRRNSRNFCNIRGFKPGDGQG